MRRGKHDSEYEEVLKREILLSIKLKQERQD
jgi:hypothetical protein